jgi:hypothetical protein
MRFRDSLKILISYLKEFPNPRFMERHTKLTTSCKELNDYVHRLEQENALLKKKLDLEGRFSRHNGAYYFETPEGHQAPFCSECWDVRGRLVRLKIGGDGVIVCPQCEGNGRDSRSGGRHGLATERVIL